MGNGMRLYCGNLPYSTTEEQLRRFFEQNNFQVEEVHIVLDGETRRSKGFGFVTIIGDNGQQAIDELHETQFDGRKIVVSQAREKTPRRNQEHRADRGEKNGNRRGNGRGYRDDY